MLESSILLYQGAIFPNIFLQKHFLIQSVLMLSLASGISVYLTYKEKKKFNFVEFGLEISCDAVENKIRCLLNILCYHLRINCCVRKWHEY